MMKSIKKTQPVAAHSAFKLNRKTYYSLFLFQLLNLLTLVMQFHLLYIIFAILALLLLFSKHRQLPSQTTSSAPLSSPNYFYAAPSVLPAWLIMLLALTACIAIAFSGRSLGLLLSMIHLLCCAYSLKMFEIRHRKDLYQLVVLGIFVATSALIFTQSLYFSLAVIVLVFSNFLILLNLFSPKQALPTQGKLLAKLTLCALPFAIILFIGFPKLSPFWQVPNVKSAKVGLSDRVKIGDIAQLALSDELAFRVSFKNQTPEHAQLYWRAMVLDKFDGTTWLQAERDFQTSGRVKYGSATLARAKTLPDVELREPAIDYQIITEPSYQSWLFALDFATSENSRLGQRSDFALFYRGIISQQLSYQVRSYPNARLATTLSAQDKALNLRLNSNNNPKLLAKARELRGRYADDSELIKHVLTDFRVQNYYYTLQPPTLENNSLDQFYFDTQAGFCEHYASSFTYLMRAAGIPARMVVGYLGGEVNPNGDYLTVYQRNAHAWAEVWLPEQGWQRVDPTAAVDPERVESGFSNSLLQEYADLSSSVFSMRSLQVMWWYNQLKLQIDAIDYQWTRWVIGYTGQQQSRFLQQLLTRLKNSKDLLYGLFIAVAIMLLLKGLTTLGYASKSVDDVKAIYLKMLTLLAAYDIGKEKSMTAQQFSNYIYTIRPDISAHVLAISSYFMQQQYQSISQSQRQYPEKAISNNAQYQHQDELNGKPKPKSHNGSASKSELSKMSQHYRHLHWQLFCSQWRARLTPTPSK